MSDAGRGRGFHALLQAGRECAASSASASRGIAAESLEMREGARLLSGQMPQWHGQLERRRQR
jgi:hypothetical protein